MNIHARAALYLASFFVILIFVSLLMTILKALSFVLYIIVSLGAIGVASWFVYKNIVRTLKEAQNDRIDN